MLTPKKAEQLASKILEDYVNACECKDEQDVANVLMKLVSLCGLAMCAVVGQKEAIERMQGTTNYISRKENSASWDKTVVQ